MANWCRYCKGSYPRYWCEVTNDYIPSGIVERSCKNNGYKCSYYYVSTMTGFILKKKQDDPVLESIRNLRDEYLEKDEKYKYLLEMYDILGPSVAKCMAEDSEKEVTAAKVYSVLGHIANLVSKEEIPRATERYSRLVGILLKKYDLVSAYEEDNNKIIKTNKLVKKQENIEKPLD